MNKETKERFWNKVNIRSKNECWEWQGYINTRKYGLFGFKGKLIRVHRFAWLTEHKTIPEGLWVLHKCDNTICVNPNHLFLGTHKDNMIDMTRKTRQAYGENHSQNKLTDKQVIEIRSQVKKRGDQARLARKFNVSEETISSVFLRKTWKHIN